MCATHGIVRDFRHKMSIKLVIITIFEVFIHSDEGLIVTSCVACVVV